MSDSEHPPANSLHLTHSCNSDTAHYTQYKDIVVYIAARKMQRALSHLMSREFVEVKTGILAQDCLCVDPVKLPACYKTGYSELCLLQTLAQ